MGSKYLTDLADVCRGVGLTVKEYSNWKTRARGSGGYDTGRPTHVMAHHTASPPSWSGQKDADYCTVGDEDAPLSNLYLDQAGVVWVLAAGATNTNGKGHDYWGGGVPDDSMNSYAIGIEANGGYGYAWPQVQQDAYVKLVNVLCTHYGISNNCVRGHFEWAPDRKVDPAGTSKWASGNASWDMNGFRADCAVQEEDMPITDADAKKIAKAVWDEIIAGDKPDENKPARWRLKQIQGMIRWYLGGWQDSQDAPTGPTMLKQIFDNTKK